MNKKFLSRKGVEEILAILTREAEVPVYFWNFSVSIADLDKINFPRDYDGRIREPNFEDNEYELELVFRFRRSPEKNTEAKAEAKPAPEPERKPEPEPGAADAEDPAKRGSENTGPAAEQSEAGRNDRDFRKFRIYDRERQRYLESDDIVMTQDGRLIELGYEDEYVFIEDIPLDGDRYVVELSTGCRDRSGKLIYEGDICDDHGTLYVIRRGEAYGVAPHLQPFKTDDPEYGNWNYEGGMPKDTADPIHGVDIVGNIHETPYLVKGEEK